MQQVSRRPAVFDGASSDVGVWLKSLGLGHLIPVLVDAWQVTILPQIRLLPDAHIQQLAGLCSEETGQREFLLRAVHDIAAAYVPGG